MKVRGVSIVVLVVIAAMASGWAVIRAQQPRAAAKDPNTEADDKILAEVRDHNEIMSNLEYLSDMIGARLTGSENLKKANDWTRQKFADYGVANPHLESWTIAHAWERGAANGQHHQPSAASAGDCVVRLGAFDKRRGAWAGSVRESTVGGRSRAI